MHRNSNIISLNKLQQLTQENREKFGVKKSWDLYKKSPKNSEQKVAESKCVMWMFRPVQAATRILMKCQNHNRNTSNFGKVQKWFEKIATGFQRFLLILNRK